MLLGLDGTPRIEARPGAEGLLQRCAEHHSGRTAPFARTLDSHEGWMTFGPAQVLPLSAVTEGILAGTLPKLAYGVATAFIERLLDALELAHADGVYFETLGMGNILSSPAGELTFLGLGGLQISSPVYGTPEVGLGDPATPGSDMYAASQVLRTALPVVDLPAALRRIYTGRPERLEGPFWRHLIRIERLLGSTNPGARRLQIDTIRRIYRGFWKLVGVGPDHEALSSYIRATHSTLSPHAPSATYDAKRQALYFADGQRLELGAHPVQARLLAVLIEAHADERCPGLDATALIDRVWTDENIMPAAAKNRLYVAISKLRKAGLNGHLSTDSAGLYRLAPELRIEHRRLPGSGACV